jgi:hypothetical protein
VHDPKEFVIAAMFAACACRNPALAQQDAAQKASEGGIDHWIEYYKGQQSTSPVPPRQETAEHPAPTEPGKSPASTGKSREPAAKSAVPK